MVRRKGAVNQNTGLPHELIGDVIEMLQAHQKRFSYDGAST